MVYSCREFLLALTQIPQDKTFFISCISPSIFNLILWSLTILISFWFKTMYFITELFIYSAVLR